MPWTYEDYSSKNDDNIASINRKLSGLPPEIAATAKVAQSDQKNGASRGLVIWYEGDNPPDIPQMPNTVGHWQKDFVEASYSDGYRDLVERLNALPAGAAAVAHVAMTNAARVRTH